MEDLQELAETAWDEFRARYHAQIGALTNGEDGSTGLNGNGILRVRSDSHRIAVSIHYVTEQLNGSGELPDTNALRSFAENAGLSLEDFTCMVLSLMFLMDGIFSIHTGKQDMVVQMFRNFMSGAVPPSTLESTRLKTRTQMESTRSPEPVDALTDGPIIKSESPKQSAPLKKGPLVKGSGKPSTSRRAKAPPKK